MSILLLSKVCTTCSYRIRLIKHHVVQVVAFAPHAELCSHTVVFANALKHLNLRQLRAPETLSHGRHLCRKLLVISVNTCRGERQAVERSRRPRR